MSRSRLLLAPGALAIAMLLSVPALPRSAQGAAPAAGIHSTRAGLAAPTLVDARNLPGGGSPRASRPRLHPEGEAALAREKAEAGPFSAAGGPQRSASSPSIVTNVSGFDGIASSESACGCYPPDGAIAVGPDDIVGGVNTAVEVWDKSGNTAPGFPKSLASLLSNPACLPNFSDPFAEYDATAGRFMLGALTYDSSNNSVVCVGVTQTGDPTGVWQVYGFADATPNDLFDFPRATIGSDAIFVTGNRFQNGTTFTGVRIYAYDKSQMYAGTAATSVYVDVGNNAAGKQGDTLTPARGVTAASTGYFIAADNSACPCSSISLWKWSNPFGGASSSFALQGGVTVASYGEPPNAPQLGGHGVPGLITTNDAGNLAAYWYGGTVYGAHSVGVNPGGGTVAGVQWYQLGNVDGTPTLLQQGIMASGEQYRFFPDLSVDSQGNMALAYAYSSSADYAGIRYTGRLASDPAGAVQAEAVMKAGEDTANGGRWGDYAGAAVDPDGCTLWHLEEYARAGSLWGTWAGSMRASTCTGAPPPDTDGDGCPDADEPLLVPPTDPNDPWDFYSVPVPALFSAPDPTTDFKDSIVAASDAQAVFAYFKVGAKTGTTVYDQDLNGNGIADGVEYDRTAVGPGQSGPPDGVISASDAQVALAQFKFGYAC